MNLLALDLDDWVRTVLDIVIDGWKPDKLMLVRTASLSEVCILLVEGVEVAEHPVVLGHLVDSDEQVVNAC